MLLFIIYKYLTFVALNQMARVQGLDMWYKKNSLGKNQGRGSNGALGVVASKY